MGRDPPVKWRWVATVALMIWAVLGRAAGQPRPDVGVHLPVDTVLIGERFTVTLTARTEATRRVQFPSVNAPVFGNLEVLSRRPVQTRQEEAGYVVDSVAYEVTTFALDSVRVPPLPIRVHTGTDTAVVSTRSRTATVASVLGADASGLQEGDPLAPFPRPVWVWLVLFGVASAVLVGGGYLWTRYVNARGGASGTEGARTEPPAPYEAATARLRTLRSYDLTDSNAVESFYVELADIIRTYLSRRLGMPTRERTTRDVVAEMNRRNDIPPPHRKKIQDVLEEADLVKFAKRRPAADPAVEALQSVRAALEAIETAPPVGTSSTDGVPNNDGSDAT